MASGSPTSTNTVTVTRDRSGGRKINIRTTNNEDKIIRDRNRRINRVSGGTTATTRRQTITTTNSLSHDIRMIRKRRNRY